MLRSDLCDYSDAYIVVKGTIVVTRPNIIMHMTRYLLSKIMHHLIVTLQKLITRSLTMQKI